MTITKASKIYIAGHTGLVGSAIWNNLVLRGYTHLVGRTHTQLDLTNQQEVNSFFAAERPDAVVLAAAYVGGIMANSVYRADFIMQNTMMQCNVISAAHRYGVKKLLFLGSTCIYPKMAQQPMNEAQLLASPLEYSNEPYAIAKIAGLKMCESYNLQYGTNYIAVMPTNLYGPNDNFHLENSHVMPAMMRKIYLAKLLHEGNWQAIRADLEKRAIRPAAAVASVIGSEEINHQSGNDRIMAALAHYGIAPNEVTLWGTGNALREFLWSEDMADASVYLLLNVDFKDIIGIDSYSSVQLGEATCGKVERNNDQDRGGAITALGEIRNTHINIGTGKEISIARLAALIAQVIGFEGTVKWDDSKPDGTPRKLVDVTKLHRLGWHHGVEIEQGVEKLYQWYRASLGEKALEAIN